MTVNSGQFVGGYINLESTKEETLVSFRRYDSPGLICKGSFGMDCPGPSDFSNDPIPALLTEASKQRSTPYLDLALKEQKELFHQYFDESVDFVHPVMHRIETALYVPKFKLKPLSHYLPSSEDKSYEHIGAPELAELKRKAGLGRSYGFSVFGRYERQSLRKAIKSVARRYGKHRIRNSDVALEEKPTILAGQLKALEDLVFARQQTRISDYNRPCVVIEGNLCQYAR